MRIQHNIMAMNAYRNYTNNVSAMKANLEKLSSGYKINRAGDDAAGLAISEKMRAQITGLETAQKNAKDGISLVQTAEGALTEVHDMLNRMVELATQSANGTYDNTTDRKQLQKEVDQLVSEINRIADSSNFNGIKLLDGSLDAEYQKVSEAVENFTGIKLPSAGEVLGTDTVLHKGNVESAGTEFSVNLGNYNFSNREGDTLTVTVGDGEDAPKLVLEGVADGEQMDSKAIAEALAKKYEADGIEMKDADGNAQKFTVEVGKTGYDLVFKQVNSPLSEGEVVQAPNSVKIEGVNGPVKPDVPADPADTGTVGKYTFQITGAFAAGDKVTIAGKEITFDLASTGENSISATDNATAVQQAAAIAKLFENDADWKVTVGGAGNDELTFEQRVASESNVLEAPVISSSINGTGKLSAFTEKDAFTPASYEFDFSANAPAAGEQLNLGKIAVKFTNNAPNADNEIQLSGNTAADLTSIANYINKNSELAGFTAKADGTKLTLTANEGTTEVPAATSVTAQPTGTAPAVTANADGTWTISLTDATGNNDFAATDKLSILGVDITFAGTANTGGKVLKHGDTVGQTATDLATILNAAATDAANRGKNIGNLKFTADAATGTIKVEQVVASDDVGKIAQTDVQTSSATAAAAAPTVTTTAAGAASWTVDVETAFANGDKLIIEDADGNKTTISFDTAGAGGAINVTTDNTAALQATAIQGKLTAGVGGLTVTDLGNGKLQFTQTAAGTGNVADLKISVEKATTGTVGAINTTQTPKNPATGDPADIPDEPGTPLPGGKDYLVDVSTIKQGVSAAATRLASTIFKLDDNIIKDGNILKIGDQSFTIKRGADSTTEAAEGTELLDLSKFDEADVLKEAAIMLSNATVGNGVFESNGYDGTSVSFLEKQGTSEDLTSLENIEKQFSYGTTTPSKVTMQGKSLTLQIGDTADDFNQLKVNIKDMHAASLGLDKISIAEQDKAADAVRVIKDAINSVSDLRGTLGATQNRLDHTINNLSVMTENIQDAESTIRDTDVADEMMKYTKNNILIQSAQAMLAQANQVPQGVLQLLQ